MTKGYILYDLAKHVFFTSRDVIFREAMFPFKHMTTKRGPLLMHTEEVNDVPINDSNQ